MGYCTCSARLGNMRYTLRDMVRLDLCTRLIDVQSELHAEIFIYKQTPVDLLSLMSHEEKDQMVRLDGMAIVAEENLAESALHPQKPQIMHFLDEGIYIILAIF